MLFQYFVLIPVCVCLCVCVKAHPSKEFFAVAEKGNYPDIIVYEYPSLRPYRILRGNVDKNTELSPFFFMLCLRFTDDHVLTCMSVGGTEKAYSCVDFNQDGKLLASVGSEPDYMLTLWNWRQEEVILSCKAISQDVFRLSFSPYNPGLLTSSGSGHIK